MKKTALLLLILCLSVPAFCRRPIRAQVQRTVAQAQLVHGSRVEIKFNWKKQNFLHRRVRFHRGQTLHLPYPAQYKTTRCAGVLLSGSRVATAVSCLHDAKGFKLQQITLSFSNGKEARIAADQVVVNGDIAQIAVDPVLTRGLAGAETAAVSAGRSLQDVYGKEFASALQNFLISHGVVSARAARMTGRKASIEKGEPFFFNGKLVAVFNSVPTRLPVALFGQISEDFLAVFRS